MPTIKGTGASSISNKADGRIGIKLKHHLNGEIRLLNPKMN